MTKARTLADLLDSSGDVKSSALDNATSSLSDLSITATASELNTLDGITATTAELNLMDGVTATTTEINYLDGVTSNIQTQINGISSEVVDDTTPSLGGNLDVAGNEITNATSNGDIVLSTGGTGNVRTKIGSGGSSLNPTALAFNRSVGDGEIYNSSSNAFQFNHNSNKLALQVYNSAGTTVTNKALVVDDAGKIGVGLLSPARPIHVYNSSPNLRLQDSDGSTGAYVDIGADTSGSCYLLADHGNNSAGSMIRFWIDGGEKASIKNDGTWGKAPKGTVMQVVQDVETAVQSYAGTGESTILSASITPKSTSSKILVMSTTNVNITHGYRYAFVKLYRGSSQIFLGNSSGNRERVSVSNTGSSDGYDRYVMQNQKFAYLDSPSTTSAVTYNVKMGNSHYNSTTYNNRPGEDSNATWHHRGASSLILMEIAG